MPAFSKLEHEFQLLEAELKRLEAEYNMFFAGRLPRLPWETRGRVEAMVKRIGQEPSLSTGDSFRFETLQTRFTKFCELWERTQFRREGGRSGPWRPRPATPAAPAASVSPAPPSAPVPTPGAPVAAPLRQQPERPSAPVWTEGRAHVTRLGGQDGGDAKVRELYEQLRAARQATGEPDVAYDRFAQLVRRQIDTLGGASKDVTFRVAVRDGRVAFTAKTGAEGSDDESG